MAEGKPIRCAVYTRKSSEEGLEQSFNSLHAQREACEAYVLSQKHEGWVLVPTPYDDGGFSGGSMERPALKALMADVDAGLIDTVVVYKVDRLTRSLADFAKMVELFDGRSVSFVSVTQAFNTTTSMGRLTLNVLLSFAQFEREVTGERIRDKIAQSKAKGMWMGGAVPLGYDIVDRHLIVNEPEAARVRELFALYLERPSVDEVVAIADARGIRSKQRTGGKGAAGKPTGGTRLGRGSLYRILANPIYAGEIGHKGKSYPGQHAGIVAREVYDATQAKLASARRKGKGVATGRTGALLTGLLIDGEGNKLTPTHTGKASRRYIYYAGGTLRLPAAELETLVTKALADTLASPAKLAGILPDLRLLTPELIESAGAILSDLKRGNAAKQRGVAAALIEQVKVTPTAVVVTIKLAALGGISGSATLVAPATIGRNRAKLTLVVPGAAPPKPDAALITMVARARHWFELIAAGKHATMEALAAAEQEPSAHVRQTIGAAFLAPDLVTAIVEGRQPLALTATKLKALLPLPTAWPEQRALVAELN